MEDHIRRLHERIQSLQSAAAELKALEQEHYDDHQQAEREIERLHKLIADSQEVGRSAARDGSKKSRSYAVVPYEGPNGTFRRPIYIECVKGELVLQPEGVHLTADDLRPPVTPGNPLASVLRATRDHLVRLNPKVGESRDTVAVSAAAWFGRMDLIVYDRARQAIEAGDFDLGFELVESDWKLKFPQADPQLASIEAQALEQARARQQMLAAAAPRAYGNSSMASSGEFDDDDGYGGGGGGSGGGGSRFWRWRWRRRWSAAVGRVTTLCARVGMKATTNMDGGGEGESGGGDGSAATAAVWWKRRRRSGGAGSAAWPVERHRRWRRVTDAGGVAGNSGGPSGRRCGGAPSGVASQIAGAGGSAAVRPAAVAAVLTAVPAVRRTRTLTPDGYQGQQNASVVAGSAAPGDSDGPTRRSPVRGAKKNERWRPESRGKDWALKQKPPRSIPVRRTIRVTVGKDQLAILPDSGPATAGGKVVPMRGRHGGIGRRIREASSRPYRWLGHRGHQSLLAAGGGAQRWARWATTGQRPGSAAEEQRARNSRATKPPRICRKGVPMKRVEMEADQMPGQDSFLDVITNIVGILILLVLVVGLRTQRSVHDGPDPQVAEQAHAQDQLTKVTNSALTTELNVRELVHRVGTRAK